MNVIAKVAFLHANDQAEEMKLLKYKLQECISCIEALEAVVLQNSYNHSSYVIENSKYNTNEWMYILHSNFRCWNQL